ncbi:MAG: autotransporter outer membrane beta-barrel domain-containing protein [Neisseriaceae bacterium]|nr:autotransporter outer membrane beta-barrel domain-containing protein [Neisseriaceae bacterium]
MNTQKSILALAITTALSVPTFAAAATFCNADQSAVWGGSVTWDGTVLSGQECLEIGAGMLGTDEEYAGTGINMTLEDGSRLSVLGYLKDSTAQSGSEVYISKDPRIAWDDYDRRFPATATNLQVDKGALIRVLDGGTLKDSAISGTVYVSENTEGLNDPGLSIDNTINDGGKMYVYLSGQSSGTTINQGGYEHVQQAGQATGTQVNQGGTQNVNNDGTAYNTIIHDGGRQLVQLNSHAEGTLVEAGGSQLVYHNAQVSDSIVYGEQTLFENTAGKGAAQADNTKLYGEGKQRVQNGASATHTQLFDQSTQSIYAGSSTDTTTINDQAKTWLAAGAQATGLTQVNQQGQLQLQAGDGNGAYAEHVVLNGPAAAAIIIPGANGTDATHIGQLNGDGQVRFVTTGNELNFTNLNVDKLAGNMQFFFDTEINSQQGDYLTLKQASGQHKVTVQDSGAEITRPDETNLDLITDQSGGAGFDLAALNGANIQAVDGGSYLYYLHAREENGEKVWYLSATKEEETPNPNPEPEPGPNPEPNPEPNPNPEPGPQPTPNLSASNHTKAILALAAAPQFIFNNELNNLRFRHGSLKENAGQGGVWTRAIGAKTNVDSGNTQFKLEQAGVEVGADTVFENSRGQTLVGLFGSWGNADVKHALGGTSKVNSSSLGAYATYFDQSGLYVDGVLKLNHFRNKLQAVSPTGANINGDYSQNAVGGALEVGFKQTLAQQYFVEPYGRLSYVQVNGTRFTTNGKNGMKVNIDDQKSFQTEIGLSAGKDFQVNKAVITPYLKAAWAHEFQDNNRIHTNKVATWENDFSGSVGKFGLGLNAKISDTTALFTELNYTKGSKVEAPIQANIGLRHTF